MNDEEKQRRFDATRDEAELWHGPVQPCPHCGEAIPYEDDVCTVCITERRSGRMERLEQEVESLRRQLAEARALLAERKWNPTEHPQ